MTDTKEQTMSSDEDDLCPPITYDEFKFQIEHDLKIWDQELIAMDKIFGTHYADAISTKK